LRLPVACPVWVALDREEQRERGRGVLALRGEVRIVLRGDLQDDRGVGRNDPVPSVLPLLLDFLRRAEQADRGLHGRLVEGLVRRGEGGGLVQREVHLQIAAAVVDARIAFPDVGGQRARV